MKPTSWWTRKKSPELNTLNLGDNGLSLGAAVPCYRIYQDPAVAAAYPGLIDAAGMIGSIQIQGRATVGGNLCNAAPSGDTIPPVITLGGEAHINGPNGWRTMPAENFCTGPGRNALENGELLVAIQLPAPAANSGTAYLRFIPRNEMDIAVAGVSSTVQLDASGQTIESARIALASVGPTPILATAAGDSLAGKAVFRRGHRRSRPPGQRSRHAHHRYARHHPPASPPGGRADPPHPEHCHPARPRGGIIMPGLVHVTTTINGNQTDFLCEPRQSLLECLRDVVGMTGSKEGCNDGNCGACTVNMDGRIVCSCLVLGVEAQGAEVNTIEGVASAEGLHPIQQSFLENAALQCGICTPGFIVAAKALLENEPDADEARIRHWLGRQPVSLHRLRQNRPRRPGGRGANAGGLNHATPDRLT